MTPYLRQTWIADECRAPPPETSELRGTVLRASPLSEGRSAVSFLLMLRSDIPIDIACWLLRAAPKGLSAEQATAWVGSIFTDETHEAAQ